MKLPAKFFEELLRLAQRHGIGEIGTSLIRTGDDDKAVAELVICSDELSDSRTPGSAWQMQNYLESFGIPRERFPVRTDLRGSMVRVVNPGSYRHGQQLAFLGEFLGLAEIRYLDRGNGEDYTLVRPDGGKLTITVRGNRDQGGFLAVDGALDAPVTS